MKYEKNILTAKYCIGVDELNNPIFVIHNV